MAINYKEKRAVIRGAYNAETWMILGRHVNESGWVNTDHLHDPVSIHQPEYKTVKNYNSRRYSCGEYIRPSELRESLKKFKKGFPNEKFYRKLSKKERRLFRLNCETYDKERFKYILNNTSVIDCYSDFIEFAFAWSSTPQKGVYWLEISRRFN